MKCPDCGKTIGRFRVTGDSENDKTKQILTCPRSGDQHVLNGESGSDRKAGPKDAKRKKSRRKDFVPPEKKKKTMVTSVIDQNAWAEV